MKYLHTMIRVVDLKKSIQFYTEVLGLKLHRQNEYPEGKFTLAFLGNHDESEPFLELTYNWGTTEYQLGTAYGHMAFGVTDIYKKCQEIEAAGGKITRKPGPMRGSSTVLAFVEDPDGYKVELIER